MAPLMVENGTDMKCVMEEVFRKLRELIVERMNLARVIFSN
jgi:hypothetical protein